MKLLALISIFLAATILFGVVLEAYDMNHLEISLMDIKGEGNSEKDTPENAEDDTEIYSNDLLELPIPLVDLHNVSSGDNMSIIIHFMEILHPPPETI